MSDTATFVKWFILFMAMIVSAWIASAFGVFSRILAVDSTYLCASIMVLFVFFSLRCGYYIFNYKKKTEVEIYNTTDWGYTWANIFSGMGLIGTVIGLISVMTFGFQNVDVSNQATVKQAITGIGVGTGIALYTTLVGLAANVLLKLQYGLLEKHPKNKPVKFDPIVEPPKKLDPEQVARLKEGLAKAASRAPTRSKQINDLLAKEALKDKEKTPEKRKFKVGDKVTIEAGTFEIKGFKRLGDGSKLVEMVNIDRCSNSYIGVKFLREEIDKYESKRK